VAHLAEPGQRYYRLGGLSQLEYTLSLRRGGAIAKLYPGKRGAC